MKMTLWLFATVLLFAASCGDSENDGRSYLFVQNADHAVLTESTLMLRFVSEQTGWFTDRPYREAGQMPTEEFVRLWNEGENSFADNLPNADFTCEVGDEVVNYVVTLSKPVFDRKTINIVDVDSITQFERVDLTYDVSLVPSSGEGSIDELYTTCTGPAHLFIDNSKN
jgi:hypothetical protein